MATPRGGGRRAFQSIAAERPPAEAGETEPPPLGSSESIPEPEGLRRSPLLPSRPLTPPPGHLVCVMRSRAVLAFFLALGLVAVVPGGPAAAHDVSTTHQQCVQSPSGELCQTVTDAPEGSYTAISAGGWHSCAIDTAGAIGCWGRNSSGEADAPEGSYTAISAGLSHSCAIDTAGAIKCWGDNYNGQADAPEGSYTAISAGWQHSCAIDTAGAIGCWGRNSSGEADGPEGSYTAIAAAGGRHSCAIDTAGAIDCWGLNDDGQADAPEGSYTSISAGWDHSCAIAADQTIACWGNNGVGQADAPEGSYTSISAGSRYSCAIAADQTIACWGDINNGQTDAPEGRYTAISDGWNHSCAIDTAGAIDCWGANDYGQTDAPEGGSYAIAAGNRHSCAKDTAGAIGCWGAKNYDFGQADAPEGSYTAISAGGWHSCAIAADQTIACWGANGLGQADAPEGSYTAISAGWQHSCAIDTAGAIACWGANGLGQADAPEGSYTAISASHTHSCAIDTAGAIACWGDNTSGEADAPEGGGYTAIAAGWTHSCAIAADQTIACWGNSGNQTDAPEGRYTAIASGAWHSCAIAADQTIACWGYGDSGQTDPPEGRYTAIAVGAWHGCAIAAAGPIVCWGYNDDGQTDPPQALAATTPAGGAVLIEVPDDAPEGRCAEHVSRGGYAWENCAWEPYRDNPEHNWAILDADADALIGLIWEEVEVEGKPASPPTSALVPANAAAACAHGGVVMGCYDFNAHHITRSDAFTETLLHEVAHALMRDHPSIAECGQAAFDSEFQRCNHNDVFRCVADHLFTEYAGIPTAGVCGTPEVSDDPACVTVFEFVGLVTSCVVEGTSWFRIESLDPDYSLTHSFLTSESNTFDHPHDADAPTLDIVCEDGSLSVFVDFDGQHVSGQQALGGRIPVYYERDGSPPHSLENVLWEESEHNEYAFAPDPAAFAQSLAASSKFTFTAWNHDDSLVGTIVFDTTGADTEVNRVLTACGMSSQRPPDPTPTALAAPGR